MNKLLTLFFLAILLQSCSKKNVSQPHQPSTPQQPTPLWKIYKDTLPGTYTWSHVYYHGGGGPSSSQILPDTTFSILPIDDSTLKIFSFRMDYQDSVFSGSYFYGLVDTAYTVFYEAISYRDPYGHNSFTLRFDRQTDTAVLSLRSGGLSQSSSDQFKARISH